MASVDEQVLESYLGKHISLICPIGFVDDAENHCAHFVCHVLGYQFGFTCRGMVGNPGPGQPASIRVQELFPQCVQVGAWGSLPTPAQWALIFMTKASNVDLAAKTMQNVPRKHVGFYWAPSGMVYHYKNASRMVVKQSLGDFGIHYPAPDNSLFWGTAP